MPPRSRGQTLQYTLIPWHQIWRRYYVCLASLRIIRNSTCETDQNELDTNKTTSHNWTSVWDRFKLPHWSPVICGCPLISEYIRTYQTMLWGKYPVRWTRIHIGLTSIPLLLVRRIIHHQHRGMNVWRLYSIRTDSMLSAPKGELCPQKQYNDGRLRRLQRVIISLNT